MAAGVSCLAKLEVVEDMSGSPEVPCAEAYPPAACTAQCNAVKPCCSVLQSPGVFVCPLSVCQLLSMCMRVYLCVCVCVWACVGVGVLVWV